MSESIKVLVPVKRVIDPYVHVRINSDQLNIEKNNIKMSINPFDEIALEEAVLKKSQGIISEIISISIGSDDSAETLRQSLARGADKAYLIKTDKTLHSLNIAKILAKYTKELNINLVMLGKQATDSDNSQTGQMLAGLLGWSQGMFASKVEFINNNQTLEITREVDNGLEIIQIQLPAVVTADLRLNEPSYISLPNVIKAKSKPLTVINLSDLTDLDLTDEISVIKLELPPKRQSGVKLNTVLELVDKLRNTEGVI